MRQLKINRGYSKNPNTGEIEPMTSDDAINRFLQKIKDMEDNEESLEEDNGSITTSDPKKAEELAKKGLDVELTTEERLSEILRKNSKIGDYIKDFYKSNAPQFKGKSKDERRKMAIAAYLNEKKGGNQEDTLNEDFNPKDVIKLDVPLLIRLLEYAREDAKTDMDLHNVAENLIDLSGNGQTLCMNHYNQIVDTNETY